MESLFAIIFLVYALTLYKIRKDILYPPAVLSLVWGGSLFAIWALDDYFSPISSVTLTIYLVGVVVFGIGHLFGESILSRKIAKTANDTQFKPSKSITSKTDKIISVITLLLAVSLPLYYIELSGTVGLSIFDIRSFFLQVRRAELSNTIELGFILRNLIPASLFLSLYVYNIHKKEKKYTVRTYIIILISTIFQLLTGGRAGAVYLIIAIIILDLFREKRVHFKTLAIYSSILLFVIIFIAYFVGKGDVDNTKSIIENFDALYKDIVFYLLGGVVAFNNVVMYPGLIPSNGGVLRFFVQTANSLGLNVYVPNLHMQYSNIGPGLNTNVYTIFGSYYIDFGIIGTCVLMFLYGLIMYIITQKAKKGNNIHSALYAYFMAGLILSIYSEHFMTDLNYIIKLLIVLGIVELIKRLRLRRI